MKKKVENKLLEFPEQAISYAQNVIKGRWPQLEKKFLSNRGSYNARYIVLYCRRIIKKRWIKCEKKIIMHPDASYYYSLHIIKGRWEKGEIAIARSSFYSFLYAQHVIKDHFEKGSITIFDSRHENDYRDFLISINRIEILI